MPVIEQFYVATKFFQKEGVLGEAQPCDMFTVNGCVCMLSREQKFPPFITVTTPDGKATVELLSSTPIVWTAKFLRGPDYVMAKGEVKSCSAEQESS